MPIEVIGTSGINSINDITISTGGTPKVVVPASSGTLTRFVGTGAQFQGIAVRNNFGSSSVQSATFYDAVNETGVTVANMVCDINTDGSSAWYWGAQPAGTRTDRRVERMRIDNAGRLTVPNQPVAVVSFSSPTYTNFTWTSSTAIIPDILGTNSTAGFYSTSTGRFTAPVTGWYHIFLSLMCNPPSTNANRLVLRRNDVDYNIGGGAFDVIQPAHGVQGNSTSPGNQSNLDLTAVVRLTAGEYLSFAARGGSSVGPIYGGHSWGFCYLIC